LRLPGIIAGLACASAVAAAAQQVVVLKDGVASVSLTSLKPQNLSGGAALNLTLPSATMSAQASASVGHDEGNSGFWHKDAAQVDAKVQGPTLNYVNQATGRTFTKNEFLAFARDYLGVDVIFWAYASPWLQQPPP